jgi:hypothetical protein
LPIGSIWAADVGTFVPGKAEPAEGVEDLLLRSSNEACPVSVFDAEDEFSAALAGIDVVDQADVSCAYVRVACGAGSNADTYRGFGGDVRTSCHRGQTLMLAETQDGILRAMTRFRPD